MKTDQTLWTGGAKCFRRYRGGMMPAYKTYPMQQDLSDLMDAPAPWSPGGNQRSD